MATIISIMGYYQLYRKIGDRHIVGTIDHRIGPLITEIIVKGNVEWVPHSLTEQEYARNWKVDAPYTESEIESFYRIVDHELIGMINNGTHEIEWNGTEIVYGN